MGIKEPAVLKCQILCCVAVSYFYLSSFLCFSEAYTKVIFKELFVLFGFFFSHLSLGLKNHMENTYIAYILDIIHRLHTSDRFLIIFFTFQNTKEVYHSKSPDFKRYHILFVFWELKMFVSHLTTSSLLCSVDKKYPGCLWCNYL